MMKKPLKIDLTLSSIVNRLNNPLPLETPRTVCSVMNLQSRSEYYGTDCTYMYTRVVQLTHSVVCPSNLLTRQFLCVSVIFSGLMTLYVGRGPGKWSWMEQRGRNRKQSRLPGSRQSSNTLIWPLPGLKVNASDTPGFSAKWRLISSSAVLPRNVRQRKDGLSDECTVNFIDMFN